LRFRNIAATPDDPVDEWGVEGIATAIERGGLAHLQRIARRALADPDGDVALDVDQAVTVAGIPLARLMHEMLARARQGMRAEVAYRVRLAIAHSGLPAREFARRLGTAALAFRPTPQAR
jgi:methyl coenzyme M reductase beta subunit